MNFSIARSNFSESTDLILKKNLDTFGSDIGKADLIRLGILMLSGDCSYKKPSSVACAFWSRTSMLTSVLILFLDYSDDTRL